MDAGQRKGQNVQVTMSCSCERGPTFTAPAEEFIAGTIQYLQALALLTNHINGSPRDELHEPTSSNPSIRLTHVYKGGPILAESHNIQDLL